MSSPLPLNNPPDRTCFTFLSFAFEKSLGSQKLGVQNLGFTKWLLRFLMGSGYVEILVP
jgi:hypothetical protein